MLQKVHKEIVKLKIEGFRPNVLRRLDRWKFLDVTVAKLQCVCVCVCVCFIKTPYLPL